jgi:hypothetical protein
VTARGAWLTPLLGAFFAAATAMLIAAGLTLLIPGPLADWFWTIKPEEHRRLAALAPASGFFFLALAPAMTAASYGAFRRRRSGLRLATALIALNAVGDLIAPLLGGPAASLIGVPISAAIVFALTRPAAKRMFAHPSLLMTDRASAVRAISEAIE